MQQKHQKARSAHPMYPERVVVPDECVDFSVEMPGGYVPKEFTHPVVVANDELKKENGWADPMDHTQAKNLSGRLTYENGGKIIMDSKTGLPQNPRGRTGITGRGLLGKYGPNHAADPIVTRFHNGQLQVVVIKRKDTGEWAIPGGMVDPGEHVSATVRREFEEEAGNVPDHKKQELRNYLDQLFKDGKQVYSGYVDDPRNTDNAWMETVVMHFHCDNEMGELLNLHAGDDAADVCWMDVDESNKMYANLYASHKDFIDLVARSFDQKE